MANGFLSPDGQFTKAGYMNHFDLARDLLRACGYTGKIDYPVRPTDLICEEFGYLYLREHFNGLAGGIREEALDGVWMKKPLTDAQADWLNKHSSEMSETQKMKILQYL